MNVLYIGKYPPIEGGTATAAYWRIKELRQRGIFFEVLTCLPINKDYVIKGFSDEENLHIVREKLPWHIPYSQLYAEQLISLSIKLFELKSFDAVEGCYLFPYGFAAYIVSKLFNRPLILRHAGSDLYRLAKGSALTAVLTKMLDAASVLVTYKECLKTWSDFDVEPKLQVTSRYTPNPVIFKSEGEHTQTTFLGKITEKWNRRQFDYYYNFLMQNNYCGIIRVYSNRYTVEEFSRYFQSKGYSVIGNSFVTPDKVPQILQDTKYLLISEIPNSIEESSNCFVEAISAGCVPVCADKRLKLHINLDFRNYINEQLNIYEGIIK